MTGDLFAADATPVWTERLGAGAVILRGFAVKEAENLLAGIRRVTDEAPLRRMQTPGGQRMSVAMSNCGPLGWVTDGAGYRYQASDPLSGRPWPAFPPGFVQLAAAAAAQAGFRDFAPDACLINCYESGARMALHQDRDERDFTQPIVSVSLGLAATFRWGGFRRNEPAISLPLTHGDVLVWGGADRRRFHGVAAVKAGVHALTGPCRFNLTFRRAA